MKLSCEKCGGNVTEDGTVMCLTCSDARSEYDAAVGELVNFVLKPTELAMDLNARQVLLWARRVADLRAQLEIS